MELNAIILQFGNATSFVIEQMLKGDWVDSMGHKVLNNQAMIELSNALSRATTYAEQGGNSMQDEFNKAIDFAIKQGIDAYDFLTCWREGDWEGCREYGYDTSGVDN
jgi:hypothetical protein